MYFNFSRSLALIFMVLISCSSPKATIESYTKDSVKIIIESYTKNIEFDHRDYDEKAGKNSRILFFTADYKSDSVVVSINNIEIFKKTLKTNHAIGGANATKIEINDIKVFFPQMKKIIYLEKKLLEEYRYVLISVVESKFEIKYTNFPPGFA